MLIGVSLEYEVSHNVRLLPYSFGQWPILSESEHISLKGRAFWVLSVLPRFISSLWTRLGIDEMILPYFFIQATERT